MDSEGSSWDTLIRSGAFARNGESVLVPVMTGDERTTHHVRHRDHRVHVDSVIAHSSLMRACTSLDRVLHPRTVSFIPRYRTSLKDAVDANTGWGQTSIRAHDQTEGGSRYGARLAVSAPQTWTPSPHSLVPRWPQPLKGRLRQTNQ